VRDLRNELQDCRLALDVDARDKPVVNGTYPRFPQTSTGLEKTPSFPDNSNARRGGRAADCTGLEILYLQWAK